MKKFLLLLAFLPLALVAKDIVVLQNGDGFEGDVVRIGQRFLHFESQGTRYHIPAADLRYVGLDEVMDNDVDVCLGAYIDTRLHDRRVLLLSNNNGYFSDPVYLECYTYRAKTNATLQAAGGWATWLLFPKN